MPLTFLSSAPSSAYSASSVPRLGFQGFPAVPILAVSEFGGGLTSLAPAGSCTSLRMPSCHYPRISSRFLTSLRGKDSTHLPDRETEAQTSNLCYKLMVMGTGCQVCNSWYLYQRTRQAASLSSPRALSLQPQDDAGVLFQTTALL